MKGTLIVIDGTDGSGKATQVALLKKRLENDDCCVEDAKKLGFHRMSAEGLRKMLYIFPERKLCI